VRELSFAIASLLAQDNFSFSIDMKFTLCFKCLRIVTYAQIQVISSEKPILTEWILGNVRRKLILNGKKSH